ncbi:MAG: hypothetical protein LBN24_00600 [Mediterranea sp.]|jgi:hypothetical protein|nr:hypothetical protein [Mediterranea sp.]
MPHERTDTLSYRFNMSIGFVPVIISTLLCTVMSQDGAIYIGTGIGLLGMFLAAKHKGALLPNFILSISTTILVLQSLASAIPGEHVPQGYLALTLEVSILIPMLILFMHRRRFINYYLRHKTSCQRRLYAQGAEAAVVSARLALILGVIHFVAISLTVMLQWPLSVTSEFVLLKLFPPLLFILAIVLNHVAIRYFNHLMSHTDYVPVVNVKGDVIGKMPAVEAIGSKNAYINPVIRIAVSIGGLTYLRERPSTFIFDRGKTDVPMECYLSYGETLQDGVDRMLGIAFPEAGKGLKPKFTIVYHYEDKATNRLVYLFILDLSDESLLRSSLLGNGKLWSFKQIEENLGKGFFSSCFEVEYEQLKEIICIKEKYKAS